MKHQAHHFLGIHKKRSDVALVHKGRRAPFDGLLDLRIGGQDDLAHPLDLSGQGMAFLGQVVVDFGIDANFNNIALLSVVTLTIRKLDLDCNPVTKGGNE